VLLELEVEAARTHWRIPAASAAYQDPFEQKRCVGIIRAAHAVTDQAAAWTEVSALTDWDDGNSQTNTLWWVASRP